MITREDLEKKLAEYRQGQERLNEEYKRQFAALEGAIAAVQQLLETFKEEAPTLEHDEETK